MCLVETATRNTRAASDIDNSSVVAGEGTPPYRVTFDVSDQEDEAGDASSLVGDGQSRAHIYLCLTQIRPSQKRRRPGSRVK